MEYRSVTCGLNALLRGTRRYAESFSQKALAMQEAYLRRNASAYTAAECEQLRYYLKAAIYKFYLATLSLEQLWALSYAKRDKLFWALQNSLDRLDCSDDELLLSSFALETFLFQGTAFLDLYMLYLCIFFRTGHRGSISRGKFTKAIERASAGTFGHKAKQVKEYFETRVFGAQEDTFLAPSNWGALLRSLRDKIAHRDRLRPSFESNETLLDKVLFNWPTLRGITYDRFCQHMQNGMFYLITDISPILYDLEWKPGPFGPHLWE